MPDRWKSIPKAARRILREAIGETHGLDPAAYRLRQRFGRIADVARHAYLRPGDEVLFSEHGFLVYAIATLANSAVPVVVPEKNLRADVDAMLAAVTAKTRFVYLANPNNPTGSYLTQRRIAPAARGLAAATCCS